MLDRATPVPRAEFWPILAQQYSGGGMSIALEHSTLREAPVNTEETGIMSVALQREPTFSPNDPLPFPPGSLAKEYLWHRIHNQ